jgi:predicted ATPase
LMLIGAYRDNEVDSAHPLWRELDAIRQAGARVHEIVLAPLTSEDLGSLLVDSLSLRTRVGHAVSSLGRREDGWQSVFRHSVHFNAC